jgi:hypothetical protein
LKLHSWWSKTATDHGLHDVAEAISALHADLCHTAFGIVHENAWQGKMGILHTHDVHMLTNNKFPESMMSDSVIILLGTTYLLLVLRVVKVHLAYIASHGAFGVQQRDAL